MITAAAFVPSTPLLVPEAASGAAYELGDVRAAAQQALADALATSPQRVVVLGASSRMIGTPAPHGITTHAAGTGSLRGFGVALDVPFDPATPSAQPLSLASTIGAWLLARAGWPGERLAVELDPSSDDAALDACGASLADGVPTVLLVVADGSASRTEKAPASLHPEAEAFDASVAKALGSGDPGALAALDRDLASAVTSAGRPAWRTAAAALQGTAYAAELLADEAPYGVGYLVARWTR
ncbi:MAG: hypothetical protein U0R68_17895 [Candidatus Nanopelagicales bacterium]